MTPRRLIGTLIAAALLALGAGACGGDGGGDGGTTSTPPTITVPEGNSQTVPKTPTENGGGVKPDDSGGTGGQGNDPNKPDSPTNDLKAPPGPATKFEQNCAKYGPCG